MKKDVIWGLLDQALQSVTNLCVGIILIHYATKEEYGLYGVGFASLLLLIGFSNAIVSTQMTVLAPTKKQELQNHFCASLIIGFFLWLIPLFSIVATITLIFSYVYDLSEYEKLIYAVLLSSPPTILIEIMRRYFYLKLRPKTVFKMGLLYTFIYFISLTAILLNTKNNLHVYALLTNGFASLLAASIFFSMSDMSWRGAFCTSSESLKECWKDGKWALGGVLVTWGQIQGYVYVLALIEGSALVAEANAARLFLAPINVLSTGFSKVVMPRLVKFRINDKWQQAIITARKILIIMLVIIIAYSFSIYFIKDWIIDRFMNHDYKDIGILIYYWSIFFICQAFRTNNSILLQAFRLFKEITVSNAMTACVVLVISLLVVQSYGVKGVISTMSVGEFSLALILWMILTNKKHNKTIK